MKSKLNTLVSAYRSRNGQISGQDSLAYWLRAVASDPNVHTIVEIGAWEGKGSTRCIGEVLTSRKDRGLCKLISLESNRERCLRAQKRNMKFSIVTVIWGSIVGKDDLDLEGLTSDEKIWLEDDIKSLEQCPQVLSEIPDLIDALFLDRGEFSTKSEYVLLSNRVTNWLISDDTGTRKSTTITQDIRNGSTPFTVIVDSDQRNGFMVAKLTESGFAK
jgi:hypothetical protein